MENAFLFSDNDRSWVTACSGTIQNVNRNQYLFCSCVYVSNLSQLTAASKHIYQHKHIHV